MTSLVTSLMRLLVSKNPTPAVDEERGTVSSTLVFGDSSMAQPTRSTLISTEDQLTLFRLLVGISNAPFLGYTPSASRPAPNLGIYTRVVHSEQKAKDGFKVFSTVINACYGLQIVVAAALTAMGAGATSYSAITAFGAINTVIAGFLTFLKGSGLPNRLKYYGSEWKKLREYIEQRERDFSREGCTLNVYEVVESIETMYKNIKDDVEINTPDGYISKTSNQIALPRVPPKEKASGQLDISKIAEKVKVFAANVEQKTSHVAKDVEAHEHQIAKDVRDYEKQMTEEFRSHEEQAARTIEERRQELNRTITDQGTKAAQGVQTLNRTLSDHGNNAVRGVQEVQRTASDQGRKTAQDIQEQEQKAVDKTSKGIQGFAEKAMDRLAKELTERSSSSGHAKPEREPQNDDAKQDRTIP